MWPWSSLLGILITLCSFQKISYAFSFSPGAPTQCDNLTLNWQGGTPPFQLLLIPVFGIPQNISVPSSAFNNEQGSFSFQLPLPQMQQFVIAMSDATGFGTGGVSGLLTVGTSKGGRCNTKSPSVSFTYQLNTALQQCRPFTISGYSQGVQPVTLYGVIPLGRAFAAGQSLGQPSFDWTADAAAGTSIIFFMVDAQGRQGGSSDINKVGNSNDASCLNQYSPSSTASVPTHALPPSTSAPSKDSKLPKPNDSSISLSAIAGTVIGAILFLAVIITLGLFFFRRKQSFHLRGGSKYYGDQTTLTLGPHSRVDATTHTPAESTYMHQNDDRSNVNPFEPSSSVLYESPVNAYRNVNPFPPNMLPPEELSNPHSPTSVFTPSQVSATYGNGPPRDRRDAKGGVLQPPTRYIIHTDLEDEPLPPSSGDIVELPPRYTERHTVVNEYSELGYL